MSPRKKEEAKSFEENMKRLEEIVSRLERGDAALADSLSLSSSRRALMGSPWSCPLMRRSEYGDVSGPI